MNFANVVEQYRNFPEISRDDVVKLLEWASKQPHLPKITELEGILFLHSNYCKMEAAKTTIDNYYTCRTHVPHFFDHRDVLGDDMKMAQESILVATLPKPTRNGNRIILNKFMDADVSKFSFNGALKLFTFVSDAWLLDDGTSEGHLIVSDMSGLQLGHVTRMGIMSFKHYLYYLQEALPFRLKGLHLINVSPLVDKIVVLMKPFMKKELWDMFYLHTTMESVYEFIDPEVLPSDYEGGQGPSLKELHESTYNHLVEMRDYFLEEEKSQRINEKLRPGKPKNVGEMFGMEGNFKKLEFD